MLIPNGFARAILRTVFFLSLCAALLVTGFAQAAPVKKIGLFADSHYYLDHFSKPYGDRVPIALALLDIFEQDRVSLIVGLGDHYDHWAFEGTAEERAAYNASQRDAYEAAWDLSGIRKLWTIGNHDKSRLSIEGYVELSSYTPAENFIFDIPGTDIRTVFWSNVRTWSASPETLAWLDAELAKILPGGPDQDKRILGFAHMPISSIVTPSAVFGNSVTLTSSTPIFSIYNFPEDPDPSFVKIVRLRYDDIWYDSRYVNRISSDEIQVDIIDTLPSTDPADDWTESGERVGTVSANQKEQRDLVSSAAAVGAKVLGIFSAHKHNPGYITIVSDIPYINIRSSDNIERCGILTVTNNELILEGFNGQQSYHLDISSSCNVNGICESGEDCLTCPSDCVGSSGAACGNGTCEAALGEDCLSCPADCAGRQSGNPSQRFCCGDGDGENPVSCEDSRCTRQSFACTEIPVGAFCCGDAICDLAESCSICSLDCEGVPEICDDGIDNDCNGMSDCSDAVCSLDPMCAQNCVPTHSNERGKRCNDAIDNDCDGLIDAADPDC